MRRPRDAKNPERPEYPFHCTPPKIWVRPPLSRRPISSFPSRRFANDGDNSRAQQLGNLALLQNAKLLPVSTRHASQQGKRPNLAQHDNLSRDDETVTSLER